VEEWSKAKNPFFEGPSSDALALIPLVVLTVLLYVVGREWWLRASPPDARERGPGDF
jgi:hypothetical protein